MGSRLCTSPPAGALDPIQPLFPHPYHATTAILLHRRPGCALQGLRSRPHFCREGDIVASIPTLDWQCYSSLKPTPDPGLKVHSPEVAMALGVVGWGSRSWRENIPGSISPLWPRQCTSVWWLAGSTTQPWSQHMLALGCEPSPL